MAYQIGRKISSGGMGDVHLARQTAFGGFEKVVLIKRVNAEFARDGELVAMFMNEARLAAKIRHPNVVETFNVDRDDRGLFIVMGYLPGISLAEALRASPRGLPLQAVTRIAADMAAALSAAHSNLEGNAAAPIIHRDVTPNNVQLCRTGDAKLLDFGVAQLRSNSLSPRADRVRGTLAYMSPEMLADVALTPASDLFQLGVVIYESCTGEPPFAGDTEAQISAAQASAVQFDQRWPKSLRAVVSQCLALSAADRPSSASALADQLERVCRELSSYTHREVGSWLQTQYPDQLASHEKRERDALDEMRAATGDPVDGARSELADTVPEQRPTVVARPLRTPIARGLWVQWRRRALVGLAVVGLGLGAWVFSSDPDSRLRTRRSASGTLAAKATHLGPSLEVPTVQLEEAGKIRAVAVAPAPGPAVRPSKPDRKHSAAVELIHEEKTPPGPAPAVAGDLLDPWK
jgi:serine/threonine protein kinase